MSTTPALPLLWSRAANPKSEFSRYIIMHPKNMVLPYLNQTAHTRTLNATYDLTFVNLKPNQAYEIHKLLGNQGHIHLNRANALKFPPKSTDTTFNVEATSTPTYAVAPATCAKLTISNDFVMFFPDAMVDATKFKNVNLTIGPNYSGNPTYCNPHGNETLSTFEQVLGDPNLSITNIPTFTCGNYVTNEAAISALLDILDYSKANPAKKVGMYFAVDEFYPPDPTMTSVTKELVAAGVLVGLAAGNDGTNICNANLPPQNVPGTLQIGATIAPGNECPWWTNWSDIVRNPQYGDCVQAYFPGQFKSKQFGTQLKGTSFAIPQAVAWCMRWWSQNPDATAADVISALENHTVTITKQESVKQPYYPPLTPSGQMRVVKTANYCNTNVSSNKPKL